MFSGDKCLKDGLKLQKNDMTYRITKVYETYYDAYVEADSLEEALKVSEYAQTEWNEDNSSRTCTKKYWAIIEDGEVISAGDIDKE